MRRTKIKKNITMVTIISLLFLSVLAVSFPARVHAAACNGIEVSGSGSVLGPLCIQTITPFRGVAQGGIISSLSQLLNYLFIILFLLWLVTIALTIYDYIRAEGNADMTKQSWLNIQYIWKGLSLGLVGFIGVYAIGLLAGLGNPLEWPNEFYQCGAEHIIYRNAKEKIMGQTVPAIGFPSGEKIDMYCCNDSSGSGPDGWVLYNPALSPAMFPNPGDPTYKDICTFFKTEIVP